jgi:His-Xaa-Ser system protein HxsD
VADSTTKGLSLDIDTGVYCLDAVQAAAYTFTDRAYVRIARRSAKKLSVSFQPKAKSADAQALVGEFHNELLHESLRRRVSEANKKIREFIVTKALVSAQVPSAPPPAAPASEQECPECAAEEARAAQEKKGPAPQTPAQAAAVDPELEKEIEKLLSEIEKSGPGGGDPLGVAVPWEKKFGAKGAAKASGKAKTAPKGKGKKAR